MKTPNLPGTSILIDIIAPGGKIKDPAELAQIESILNHQGYKVRFGENLLGSHAYLSNTLALRFEDFKKALYAPDSNIIWCYRGGSGCAELLPLLENLKPPLQSKLFLGFSDITALHIFLNQYWHWPTFHGPNARQIIDPDYNLKDLNTLSCLSYLSQNNNFINIKLLPLNSAANKTKNINNINKINNINPVLTGGNLSVICHSLGTPYQIQAENKILILEDINEPAYKIKRMLTQLEQAHIFKDITALILGDFINKNNNYIQQTLLTFAHKKNFPIYQTNEIGHGKINKIIPFNLSVKFKHT